jgi:hypothetical protein
MPTLAKQGRFGRLRQEFRSFCIGKCLVANARPDPLFRYFSNFSARCFSGSAMYASNSHGLNLFV